MYEIIKRIRRAVTRRLAPVELVCQVGDRLERIDNPGHIHVVQSVDDESIVLRSLWSGNYYVCPPDELGLRYRRVEEAE